MSRIRSTILESMNDQSLNAQQIGWQYMIELITTEKEIVAKLSSVISQVLLPLHRALGEGQAILSAEEIKTVFTSFELITQTNESFLKLLTDLDSENLTSSNQSCMFYFIFFY